MRTEDIVFHEGGEVCNGFRSYIRRVLVSMFMRRGPIGRRSAMALCPAGQEAEAGEKAEARRCRQPEHVVEAAEGVQDGQEAGRSTA